MPGRFSGELERLVQQELATGKYGSENELLLEAVRLLAERERRRERLREEIQIGRDQLDRGEYTEYDEHSLRERFDELKESAEQRIQRNDNPK